MNENYLLKTDGAVRLYREYAKELPIIDYHNHLSVKDLAKDRQYEDIYELCRNVEGVMNMFSKELRELDRNNYSLNRSSY